MELEKTFAIIKPDAVRAGKADEIKQLVEMHGFSIVVQQKLQLTRTRAEEFYGEHNGKAFFPKLVDFMTSGPVWAMVLAKPGAIRAWRSLMGPTNALVAKEQAPRSLRAMYGTDGTQNATHGSDSPESAAREIKFFFPSLVLEPLLDPVAAKQYITDKLQPALSKALTALARTKPTAERFEAITFLADFLLNNNPNKPKIVMPDAWDPSTQEEDDEAEFLQAQLQALHMPVDEEEPAAAAAAPVMTVIVQPERQQEQQQPPAIALGSRAASRASSMQHSSSIARNLESPHPAAVMEQVAEPAVVSQQEAQVQEHAVQEQQEEEDEGGALHSAATKVQASFRGYQARKEVAAMRTSTNQLPEQFAELDQGSAAAAGPDTAEPETAQQLGNAGSSSSKSLAHSSSNVLSSSQRVSTTPPVASLGEEAPLPEGSAVEDASAAYSDQQVAAVTRIQAAGRGMLDRKRVAAMQATSPHQQAQGADSASYLLEQESSQVAEEAA